MNITSDSTIRVGVGKGLKKLRVRPGNVGFTFNYFGYFVMETSLSGILTIWILYTSVVKQISKVSS